MQTTDLKLLLSASDRSVLMFFYFAYQQRLRVYRTDVAGIAHLKTEDLHKAMLPSWQGDAATIDAMIEGGLLKKKAPKLNPNTTKTEKAEGLGLASLGHKALYHAHFETNTELWAMPLVSAEAADKLFEKALGVDLGDDLLGNEPAE